MNNKTLSIGSIIFMLLFVALITRSGDIAWMTLPLLAYLGAGILQTPNPERLSLSVKRTLTETRTDGAVSIGVNLMVQNNAAEAIHITIHESAQTGMNVTDGELTQRATLLPGETTEMGYSFVAARGDFSWELVRTVISDPLDLIETERMLPAHAAIQIRPQIKHFKAIPWRPQNTVHSPGSIPAHLGGSGTDFFGVREYHPGDSLRTLDWRLTARHPGKFFTKEFEQEEIADIGLILDARQNTDLRIGEESLFEHGLGATASLAEIFLRQGNRLSLLVFGEKMLTAFPGYGKSQLHRVMSCLSKAKSEGESRALGAFDSIPIRMFPNHALIIVISPLTSSDRSLFQRLRAYGYQALLISPDPIDFAYASLAPEATNQLAIRAARIERRLWLNDIAHLHVPVIDWQVRQPLFPLVRNAMTRARGQREQ